jgi:hypothetical protein
MDKRNLRALPETLSPRRRCSGAHVMQVRGNSAGDEAQPLECFAPQRYSPKAALGVNSDWPALTGPEVKTVYAAW